MPKPKRLELQRHLHREGAESINALAKTQDRDYNASMKMSRRRRRLE